MEKDNNYYSIIENKDKENHGDKNEVWIKFQDDTPHTITINSLNPDKKIYNEVYNPINSRILLYKGIK